jgi:hypothetical protein
VRPGLDKSELSPYEEITMNGYCNMCALFN